MPERKTIRRSLTLPTDVAKQVGRIAKRRRVSDSRVLVSLIEEGIAAAKQKEERFFRLAERFRSAEDPAEIKQLSDEMGQFIFG